MRQRDGEQAVPPPCQTASPNTSFATSFLNAAIPRTLPSSFLFFFLRRNLIMSQHNVTNQSKRARTASTSTWEGQVSVITNHLSRERSVTIRPQAAPSLQHGKGKGFGRAASQERCPSVPPHLARPRTQMPRLSPGLGLRQLVEELAGFLRPPTSHFPGKHHEPGATHLACELRIDPLFPAAGSRQSRTIMGRCLLARNTVTPQD